MNGKFRVWDKTRGRYLTEDDGLLWVFITPRGRCCKFRLNHGTPFEDITDKVVIEYYIGSFVWSDRRGCQVGICQGDTIKYHDLTSDEYILNREDAKKILGQVVWHGQAHRFILQEIKKNHKGGHYFTHWDNALDLEIIGTIHDEE